MTTRETKINLLGLSLPKMQAFFHDLGEKPFRASQTLKWIHQRGVLDIDQMTDISKPLREKMKSVAKIRPPVITQELRSADGSCKWIVQVLEGENAVALHRELMGATNPAQAAPGTIRADFAKSIDANAVHGSDSAASAAREIAYFFSATDICARV